jgi:hypothetical protein
MAKESTYAGKLGDWQQLLEPLAIHAAELEYLEVPRARLADLLSRMLAANREQAAFKAAKQELSQKILGLALEGDRLATLLRAAVKQHYGIRAEKLTEFGLQPFRGRSRRKAAPAAQESGNPQVHPAQATDPAR